MRSDISLLRAARLVNCACLGDSLSKSPLSRLNEVLRRYVEQGKIPRDQPMISHRRQVIYDYLYGARDVETDRPVKEDTTFKISSISNLVTGVADQVAPLDVGIFGYSFDTGTEDIDNALDAYNILTASYRDGRYQLAIMMLLIRPGSSFQAAEDTSALKRDFSYSPLFSLCLAGRRHGYSRITSLCPRSMRNWPTGFEPALSLGISLPVLVAILLLSR